MQKTTHFLLESIRNSWVGEEAVALNYYDTTVGGELDTTFTGALHNDDYLYADWIEAVETVKSTGNKSVKGITAYPSSIYR